MGKPRKELYLKFVDKFKQKNEQFNRNQFIVPYLMSSHPGSDLQAAIELACYLKKIHYTPKQVQDFYPTPSTLSTCMYYTGVHPLTMEKVYVPKAPHEKAIQRALIQFRNPANAELVREGLKMAGREDLIGYGPKCLIRPKKEEKRAASKATAGAEKPKKTGKRKTIRNIHKKKKA